FKEIKFEICIPLSWIFNLSVELGNVPTLWKSAKISPIFKKGEASNPKNYRPIALTCVPCKILESLIRNVMTDFIGENNILSVDQFGFLPKLSTCIQLLSVLEDWTSSIDGGVPVDVIYVDFAKAFESVPHSKLLAKLDCLGFRGNLLNWLADF